MRVVTKCKILFVDIRVCGTSDIVFISIKTHKKQTNKSNALPSDRITVFDICPHTNQCYNTKANTGPAPLKLAVTGLWYKCTQTLITK